MMSRVFFRALGLILVLPMAALSAGAQAVRDPTVSPADTAAVMQSPVGVEGMTVLMREDKPYLVVGTRLYAPGEKVGNLRVERISETEIWLHDGTALIKVPRFAGIARTTVATKPSCAAVLPAPDLEAASAPLNAGVGQAPKKKAKTLKKAQTNPVATAPSAPPAAAPCEDTQP